MSTTKAISKRLFVGSLPYDTTEGDLLTLFITEGKVISIKIIKNRWNRSRGMAYVEYENESDAVKAKTKYHGRRIDERTIIVDYAEPDPYETEEGRQRHEEALENKYKGRHASAFEYNTGEKIEDEKIKPKNPKSTTPRTKKDIVKGPWRPTRRGGGGAARAAVGNNPEKRSNVKNHVRSSLFKSRTFGSKVGAKFAKKAKKK
ncbi:MAG: RNA-binding protein [Candidatus Shapirobacteria bacterium]